MKIKTDVEVVNKETPFDGYFRIDLYHLRHTLFEGGWSGVMTREIFERGHAATVLLYDPDLDKLVFIEQFRAGAMAAITGSPWYSDDASPWLIETVAGIIEEGETPEGVVRREALEEADCRISDIIPVRHVLMSPGGSSESMFIFCGRTDSSRAGGVHGIKEEHENIKVLVVDCGEAFRMADDGRIVNAMTLLAVTWFRDNREAVRARWLGKVEA